MQNKILEYLDNHKDELYTLLSDLLKIDTQNYISYGLEEEGQKFFEAYCKQHGFETDFYYPDDIEGFTAHPGYLKDRGTDKRPNVTAILRGAKGREKITLAADMDTMPVGSEDDWSVPGLGGVIKDGKIFGRGSSDDKFGIAASIFAARAIKECGIELLDDVYITSYCDEEYGGGNGALATCLKYPSDVYINLDGGSREVWPYGIGGCFCRAQIHKNETLSSSSSVFEGLKVLVDDLEEFGKKRFSELQKSPIFKDTVIQSDAYRLLHVSCGQNGLDLNTAVIEFTYYTLTEQDKIEEELYSHLKRVEEKLKKLDLIFDGLEKKSRFFHPANPEKLSADVELYRSCLEETLNTPIKIAGGCLSDLSVISKYGGGTAFNTGVFKGFGEYGGPHQIDEYVDCEEFLAVTKALALYLINKSYKKGE